MDAHGLKLAEGTVIRNLTVASGPSFPDTPDKGELFYHNTLGLCVYGTEWLKVAGNVTFNGDVSSSGNGPITLTLIDSGVTAGEYNTVTLNSKGIAVSARNVTPPTAVESLGYTPLNKAGDTMTGPLNFPAGSGKGMKVDNNWFWHDLPSSIIPRNRGSNTPVLAEFLDGVEAYAYLAGDLGDNQYHIPHDWVFGSDLYIHFHWGHNATTISGQFKVDWTAIYSKRNGVFSSASGTINPTGLNISSYPQKCHKVEEILLSTPGGGTGLLNTNDLEIDGVILMKFTTSIIPALSGSLTSTNKPFIFTFDVHYLSNGIGTKNKDPDFYG